MAWPSRSGRRSGRTGPTASRSPGPSSASTSPAARSHPGTPSRSMRRPTSSRQMPSRRRRSRAGPSRTSPGCARHPRGRWGHFPPMPTSNLIPVGWNVGQNPVNVDTNTFIGKDRMLEANGWYVFSGSGTATYDGHGYPASWTSPSVTVMGNSVNSPTGTNGLANDKGYGNSIGVWTTYHIDSAYGTSDQKSVVLGHDSLANAYVTISLASTATIDGNIIVQKWNVGYSTSNPTNWDLRLKLLVSAPSNTGGTSTWTIANPCNPSIPGNPYVVAPRRRTAPPRRRPTSPSPTRSTTMCSPPGSRTTASARSCCGRWRASAVPRSTIGSMRATWSTSPTAAGRATRPMRRPPDMSAASRPTARSAGNPRGSTARRRCSSRPTPRPTRWASR